MFLIAAVAAAAIGVSHPVASMPTMPTSTVVSAPRSLPSSTSRSTVRSGATVPNLTNVRMSPFRIQNLRALHRLYQYAGLPVSQCTYDWRNLNDEPPYFEQWYRPPQQCLLDNRPDLSALNQADTQIQTLGQKLSPWHRFTFIDTDAVTFP
jgi:hypothetical protein